jgi:hypothetical protein
MVLQLKQSNARLSDRKDSQVADSNLGNIHLLPYFSFYSISILITLKRGSDAHNARSS